MLTPIFVATVHKDLSPNECGNITKSLPCLYCIVKFPNGFHNAYMGGTDVIYTSPEAITDRSIREIVSAHKAVDFAVVKVNRREHSTLHCSCDVALYWWESRQHSFGGLTECEVSANSAVAYLTWSATRGQTSGKTTTAGFESGADATRWIVARCDNCNGLSHQQLSEPASSDNDGRTG